MIEIAGYIIEAGDGSEKHFFWPNEELKADRMFKELVENGWTDVKKYEVTKIT